MSKEDNKKVKLRPQEDATKHIVKHLEKAQKQSKIDLDTSETESLVAPIVSELYEAYEQEGTLPTLQGFADKCENTDVAEVILAIDKDPFIKRSHKAVIVVLLLLIACVAGCVAYTSYYTADTEEEETAEVEEDTDEEEEEETAEEESEEEVDAETTEEVTSEDSSEDSSTASNTTGSSSTTSSSSSSGSTSSNTSSSSNSGTSSSNTSSSSNSGSSSSNTSSSSSSTTTHTHSWTGTYETYAQCKGCGGKFYDQESITAHVKQGALNRTSCANGHVDVTELTGYVCSGCGATSSTPY